MAIRTYQGITPSLGARVFIDSSAVVIGDVQLGEDSSVWPLALIRGQNSDLLSPQTAAEMRRRRPDMLFTDVPDRAHIPFLDEPEAVALLHDWLRLCAGETP